MNKKIMEAMEYMEQKYIDEAVEPKRVSHQPLVRWGAIAACLVLVVGLCVGMLGGVPGGQQEEVVLPPTRYGAGQASASLPKHYTIDEAFDEAEVVAWVRVGDWLGEEYKPIDRTFFEAEVVECYKGEIPDEFVLRQMASSLYTYANYPIFTSGNEFLLFLQKSPLEADMNLYENCYLIIGMYSTVLDIAKGDDGSVYVSDSFGMLGESIAKKGSAPQNLIHDTKLTEELCLMTKQVDQLQSDRLNCSAYVFALDSLLVYFTE